MKDVRAQLMNRVWGKAKVRVREQVNDLTEYQIRTQLSRQVRNTIGEQFWLQFIEVVRANEENTNVFL